MNTDVEVRDSAIEGKGIFAKKDFQPGEVVLVWDTSHTVSESEIESLTEEEKHYLARYQGTWIVMQEPMRFMNHSCESNTRSDDAKDVAIRAIHQGEELTTDYRPEMVKGERMECHCGTVSCKGCIIGTGL